MKNWIFILFIFLPFAAIAQREDFQFQLAADSDTVFWQKLLQEKISIFNLDDIGDAKGDFIFRSWTPNRLLEIKKSNTQLTGTVTYFVIDAWDNKSNEVFVSEYDIPNKNASLLYNLIIEGKISEIPSDKYIVDWWHGFDGITYIFEQKRDSSYSFKHYWMPSSQNELAEAKRISSFIGELEKTGNFKQYLEDFDKHNPFVVYKYYGQSYTMQKILSNEEWEAYIKKRKNKKNKKH